VLIGGISSASRALPDLDGRPFRVARAKGARLWDEQGREYIDTALGFGATILGHAPERVFGSVAGALERGPLPAFAYRGEASAADALARHTAPLDHVVFVNTGSEAVHLACRVARAATGRRRIAKFAAAYDGWYEELALGNAGSPDALLEANTRPRAGDMVLLRYNDPVDTERLFAEIDDIAAILAEPVLANAGCILPAPGYLESLQETAHRHGSLFIADEVLMGFRLHCGLATHSLGLDPDLATVGKAIGSGIAVAALVGRAEIMEVLANGRVNRAGTYSGNPLAAAAVTATLAELEHCDYPTLLATGARLRSEIESSFHAEGIPLATSGYGSVFSLWFAPSAPSDYAGAMRSARPDLSLALHCVLRRSGALVMPGEFGRLYLSFAHDTAALGALEDAFAAAAAALGPDE